MSNPRYAPELSLRLGGGPAPAELRASLSSVRLESSFGAADRVELALVNERLRWLDHPLLALDGELALALGYAPDPLEQLFVGEIVGQAAAFPSGGVPTLTVSAQDRRARMQKGTKKRTFGIPAGATIVPIPDMGVAALVAGENLLAPEFDPVGAALSLILGGAEAIASLEGAPTVKQQAVRTQKRESDFDFLGRICTENGWDMLIDHSDPLGGHKLRFFSPLSHLAPDVELAWGRSLLEFAPRLTKVGQIVSITAYVWIARIKQGFAVTLGFDWDRMQLTLDVAPAAMPATSDAGDVVIERPLNPLTAPREIVGRLLPKLNNRLTGSGACVGDARLRPGAVVKLEGLGVQFSGLYRVTAATHTIDEGGYRTSFQVRKEIWFGSIPLADQGAVPIRLGA
ncbi:MAG: putative rane protein [Solirubrobacterales bacterium]|nr:putative rane protein [Solirubrobacterales bacterium]